MVSLPISGGCKWSSALWFGFDITECAQANDWLWAIEQMGEHERNVYFAHHLSMPEKEWKRDWFVLIKNKIYGIHDSRIPFIEMHLVKLDASGWLRVHRTRMCARALAHLILFYSISILILYKCGWLNVRFRWKISILIVKRRSNALIHSQYCTNAHARIHAYNTHGVDAHYPVVLLYP